MTITLYDLPSTIPGKAFAPNPYKTRYALNYKGIPFETEWAEFPDLPAVLKAICAPPSSVSADGKAIYTTPTIVDSETGRKITESMVIAEYLDEVYPDKPRLFPPGSAAAIHIFEQVWHTEVLPKYIPLMVPLVFLRINPQSKAHFRETREKMFNCKIEEISPLEKRAEQLEKFKLSLSKIAGYLDKNGKEKPFFLGDTFSYADCIAGAWLVWAKKMWDPAEWELIVNFNGGRWGRLVEYCENLKGSA